MSVAMRRMDSASMPSVSASRIAVCTILSSLITGRPARSRSRIQTRVAGCDRAGMRGVDGMDTVYVGGTVFP
jgi:hypothetical protein